MPMFRSIVVFAVACVWSCTNAACQEIGGGTPHQTKMGDAVPAGDTPAPIIWIPIQQDDTWTYFLMKREVSCGQFRHGCQEHFDEILTNKGNDPDPWSEKYPVRRLTSGGISDFIKAVQTIESNRLFAETEVDLPTLQQWRLAATTGDSRQDLFVNWNWTPERQKDLELALQRENFVKPNSDLATQRPVNAGESINVLAPPNIQIVDAKATHGRVSHKPGELTYQADENFSGFDLIIYRYKLVGDGSSGWVGSGECPVKVMGKELTLSTEGKPVSTGEINAIKLLVSQPPSHGKVEGPNDNDEFIYTPEAGFIGEDSFGVSGVSDKPWQRTYRVIMIPPYVENGLVTAEEDSSSSLFTVFSLKDKAQLRSHANARIECKQHTLLGGTLKATRRHYFDPGDVKDDMVELTCTTPGVARVKRLQVKVGNPDLLVCRVGESVELYREREKPEIDLTDSQLSTQETGKGTLNSRWVITFTPAKPGERLVQFSVPNIGEKTRKVLAVDDSGETLLSTSNGQGKLLEEEFAGVACDKGSIVTVPMVDYTPPKSVVSSSGNEKLEYAIVSARGERLEITRSCSVLAKDSTGFAQNLLKLQGLKERTHRFDPKGDVILQAHPAVWIEAASNFVDQNKTRREEILDVLRQALDSFDAQQQKMAIEVLASHVRQIVKTNENGYIVLQPVDQAAKDVNEWKLEHLQGNVPEILRIPDSPGNDPGRVDGNDGKLAVEYLVKGKAGSTEATNLKKLLLYDDGEKADSDKTLQDMKAGLRLIKKVRLTGAFEQALSDLSKHAFEGNEESRRAALRELKDAHALISQLTAVAASPDANIYRGFANDYAALFLAKTQYEAEKPVNPELVAPVERLSKQLDTPFFRHFASLLASSGDGDSGD